MHIFVFFWVGEYVKSIQIAHLKTITVDYEIIPNHPTVAPSAVNHHGLAIVEWH